MRNVDLSWNFPHHLHFIDLRQLLQSVVDLRETDGENVFAFAETRHFQNLIALKCAIRLHFNLLKLIILVFEEEAFRREFPAEKDANRYDDDQEHFGNGDQNLAVAMLRRLMRSHVDIEQMLLAALSSIRDPFVPARGVDLVALIGLLQLASAKVQ